MNTAVKNYVKMYSLIFIGSVIYSGGMGLFVAPNHLAPGGVTGIAVILNHSIGFPTGLTALVMNIPLLGLAIYKFGMKFFTSTLIATIMSTVFIDLFDIMEPLTSDLLLASTAGGALCAIGIGLVFRAGATTGGSDIIVKLIRVKHKHIKTGMVYLMIDAFIIAALAITSRDTNLALYATLTLIVTSKMLDFILYGPDEAKLVYIISDHFEEISKKLIEMDVGLSILNGSGAYSGTEKRIIFCVMRKQLYTSVRAVTRNIDKNAFMIITSANEVFGEGFKGHDAVDL